MVSAERRKLGQSCSSNRLLFKNVVAFFCVYIYECSVYLLYRCILMYEIFILSVRTNLSPSNIRSMTHYRTKTAMG